MLITWRRGSFSIIVMLFVTMVKVGKRHSGTGRVYLCLSLFSNME